MFQIAAPTEIVTVERALHGIETNTCIQFVEDPDDVWRITFEKVFDQKMFVKTGICRGFYN